MNVYLVYDSDIGPRVVEAKSYGKAIEAWQIRLVGEWRADPDYDGEDEDDRQPTQVHLISDEPVIRVSR